MAGAMSKEERDGQPLRTKLVRIRQFIRKDTGSHPTLDIVSGRVRESEILFKLQNASTDNERERIIAQFAIDEADRHLDGSTKRTDPWFDSAFEHLDRLNLG